MDTRMPCWTLAVVAALGLASGACEELGLGGDPDAQFANDAAYVPYYYVMIVDQTTIPSSPSAVNGADIDAVGVFAGGADRLAAVVEYFSVGPGATATQDTSAALGAPEGTCEASDGTFVSLGGVGEPGGHLIVSLRGPADELIEISNGDVITVFECSFGYSDDDRYDLYVGTSPDPESGYWHPCGLDMMGAATCTVSGVSPNRAAR